MRLMSTHDAEILKRLLDRHGGPLLLYARQWCDSPEDVLQESLIRLMGLKRPPDNPVGWIYRAVRNGAISAARAEGRRRRREAAVAENAKSWFEPTEGERLDATAATGALKQLPIEQRETIVARLWGGLSFDQIAKLTRTSTSTAHRRYEAGLNALRERLGESCLKNENYLPN